MLKLTSSVHVNVNVSVNVKLIQQVACDLSFINIIIFVTCRRKCSSHKDSIASRKEIIK